MNPILLKLFLLFPTFSLSACCIGSLNCDYYALTTERIQTACERHGGVQAVQWRENIAICKDGKLQSFFEGYAESPPRDPH